MIGCGRKASTIDDTKPFSPNYNFLPVSHASALTTMPEVEMVAAAARTEASVQSFGERWGVQALYTDYLEMLEAEHPDIVSITTQAPLHAEMTIAAAEAGAKGVYCEKAMACSLEETDAMIAACEQNGAKLLVGYPRRWYPTYYRAKAALEEGLIGELKDIYGGIGPGLMHNATHLFDLMRFFAGDVKSVAGILRGEKRGGDFPDDVGGHAWLQFESGVAGLVDGDTGMGLTLRLTGDRGSILIDPVEEGFTLTQHGGHGESGDPTLRQVGAVKQTSHSTNEPPTRSTLCEIITDFIAWIEGGPAVRCTGEDGRAALEIALAIHSSHHQDGAQVPLPMADRSLRVESR